ncbi:MAG TPA: flagellar protein FlgN, partial [Gammaproteobacteria bacterium]|nr:flagellar protein FlgN [Gammaproteobacteria bacterium]
MPAQGASQPMESLLKQEVACSEQLLECLQRERGALAQHDLDALEQITRTKLEHSEQLERLEQERRHQLAMLGFDQDGEGLRQYCKTLPNYTQLFQLWQQVISNIEACQADNLTNGGIL